MFNYKDFHSKKKKKIEKYRIYISKSKEEYQAYQSQYIGG